MTEHIFKFYPDEGKTIERMFSDDFFLENPEAEDSEHYICFYWEPKQVTRYNDTHPHSKIWTIVEAEGKEYVMEGVHFVNRLQHLIENPKMTPKRRAYLL